MNNYQDYTKATLNVMFNYFMMPILTSFSPNKKEIKEEEIIKATNNVIEILKTTGVYSLFRYSSFQKNDNDIDTWKRDKNMLIHDQFYLTPLSWQNDPYEYAFNIELDNKNKTLIQKKTQILNNIDQSKNQLSIKSFCEINDNLLLWAHYANSHTGYCVEYNSVDIYFKNKVILLPIKYDYSFPEITLGYAPNEALFLEYMFPIITKSVDWKYEKEWRIVSICKNVDDRTVESPKPKAIYLGCKVKKEYKKEMLELCEQRKISLYQMKQSKTDYKLEQELIYTPIVQ